MNLKKETQLLTPRVIWFTGLPGAGKTTLAEKLAERLRAEGLKVEHLDGDLIRNLFPQTGFSREERNDHVKRVGFLASRLASHGIFVVVSLISPFAESREFARKLCASFFEIYVSTPLEECEKRDPKGMYKKARHGLIKDFTGVDSPYEMPVHPELTIDTTQVSVDEAVERILEKISG